MRPPIPVAGTEVTVSVSVGGAVTASTPCSASDLLNDANAAMYAAKHSTRHHQQVIIRDHAFGPALHHSRTLEQDFVHAQERGQLRLWYQPIVAPGGGLDSVEALLRWKHPEHGVLSAYEFLEPLQAGAMTSPRLGRWVIEHACAQLADWRAELAGHAPRRVFCNLTPRELADPQLPNAVSGSLRRHRLHPADLGLEIVDDTFAEPFLLGAVQAYQDAGHPLSVNDFGTGYSSLSRLVSLPVSHAKIDRAFTAGLPEDPRSRALVDAVLVIAAHLGLQVIGEGVETPGQRHYLTRAGCDLQQGFHYAPALPAHTLTELLRAGQPFPASPHPFS